MKWIWRKLFGPWGLLCNLNLHRWDMPGGHCENCGACDEFFESHLMCKHPWDR